MIRIDKIKNGTYNIELNNSDYVVNSKIVKERYEKKSLTELEYKELIYELSKAIWKQNTIIRESLIANKF